MQRLNLCKLSQLRRFLAAAISSVDRGRALSPRGGRRRSSLGRAALQAQPAASAFFPSSPCRQSGTASPIYPVRQSRRRCIPRLCRSRNVPVPKSRGGQRFDSPGNSGNYGNRIPVDWVSVSRLQIDTGIASRRTRAPPQEINYPSASRKPLLEADL